MAKTVRPIPKPERPRHYVREWRKFRDLSQEQLAERIGKTHGAISQLERGLTDYTQGMLEALAYALSCEPADLLQRDPMLDSSIADLDKLLRTASLAEQQRALRVVKELLDGSRAVTILRQEDDDFTDDVHAASTASGRTLGGRLRHK